MWRTAVPFLTTAITTTHAWQYPIDGPQGQTGFGQYPIFSNGTPIFDISYDHPTLTKSVPVTIGRDNFTFRVNTTIVTPNGVDTDVQNPLVVLTQYDLDTPTGSDLNSSLRSSEQLHDDIPTVLCAYVPFGLFSAKATNDYDDGHDGDCTDALGSDCTEALKAAGYGFAPDQQNVICPAFTLPDECSHVWTDEGTGSAMLTRENHTRNDPGSYPVAYWASPLYSSGNSTYYDRETERLHVVVFTGLGTYPVCTRLKEDRIDRDSPASAGSKSSQWTSGFYYGLAGGLTVVAFLL